MPPLKYSNMQYKLQNSTNYIYTKGDLCAL